MASSFFFSSCSCYSATPGPWCDDLHAYEAAPSAVPHLQAVLRHLPLLLNFAYAHPPTAGGAHASHHPTGGQSPGHPGLPGHRSSSSNGSDGSSDHSSSSHGGSGSGGGPKAGHLVTIEFTGLGDPGALLEALTLDEYSTFEKHNMEHKAILLDRLSREKGYLVKMIAVSALRHPPWLHCLPITRARACAQITRNPRTHAASNSGRVRAHA